MTQPRAAITTILFTDLVGSTEPWQQVGDEQGQRIFMQHHELLSEVVTTNGHGYDRDHMSGGHPLTIWRYYHAMALMETGQFAQARDLLDALAAAGFDYPIDEERFRILLAELCGDTVGTLERGRRAMATIGGYTGLHQTQSIQRVAALEALACSNLLNARWQPCADAAREALVIAEATAVGNWIAFSLLAQQLSATGHAARLSGELRS